MKRIVTALTLLILALPVYAGQAQAVYEYGLRFESADTDAQEYRYLQRW